MKVFVCALNAGLIGERLTELGHVVHTLPEGLSLLPGVVSQTLTTLRAADVLVLPCLTYDEDWVWHGIALMTDKPTFLVGAAIPTRHPGLVLADETCTLDRLVEILDQLRGNEGDIAPDENGNLRAV